MGVTLEKHPTDATCVSVEKRVLAAVGYMPAMFIIVLALQHDDEFCRHHASQSAGLMLILTVSWGAIQLLAIMLQRVLGGVFLVGFLFQAAGWILKNIGGFVVSLAYVVATVLGIINAVAGQTNQLPWLKPVMSWIELQFVRFISQAAKP